MNFDFSEEQKMLQEQANKFLADRCSLAAVRKILESDEPYDRELWKGVAEMGWTGAAVPEEYGGIGFGHLELCVIAEELGRANAPIPFSSSVYLATEAIMIAGTEEQKQTYLPKLAAGDLIGTLTVAEGTKAPRPSTLTVTFENNRLNGTKIPVADGDIADFAIVVANSSDGPTLAIADLTASGVARTPVKTVDPTRSHARVTFEEAEAAQLGDAGDGWNLLLRVCDRAAILTAFEQIGGTASSLRMARGYALERYAFGRPIGSFQAIKHRLADMYIKNELARSNCYYGAWALSTDAADMPVAAAGARVAATEAFNFAAKENIQVHGGIGCTWESDCHLFYRRAKLLSLNLGSLMNWKNWLIDRIETGSRVEESAPA